MRKLKATILSLSLITVMSGAAAAPALGAISVYFLNANPLLIKLIITLPSLSIILTLLLFSRISKKISTKSIAILGLILYVLGGCGAGFVNNIYLLLVFRMILGIGVGLIMPLSTGLISYYFDKKEQSKLMGYSSAMNNLGGVIAMSMSGYLVSLNWRYSFGVYLLGLIEMILVVSFLPSINLKKSNNTMDKESRRKILPYITAMFFVMIIFYTLPSNFSIIMTKEKIIPTSLIGVLMSVQSISAFFVGLKLNSIINKFGRNTKYFACLMLVIGFLIISFVSTIFTIIIGLFCLGVGLGVIAPMLYSQISLSIKKEKAPSAMALMSVMLYLGQFLSPIVVDFLINVFNLQNIRAPFYVATFISIVLLISFRKIPVRTLEN